MFTGLTASMGYVVSLKRKGTIVELSISDSTVLPGAKTGDSISISGVCLTVVANNSGTASFHVSEESLKTTTLGTLTTGGRVNLEPAMAAADRFGGHFVTGHVDTVGTISAKKQTGHGGLDSVKIDIAIPAGFIKYVVKRGSVTVDGISLTVVDVEETGFSVVVIPHTLSVTTLGTKKPGDSVNIETDILGKYVERFITGYLENRVQGGAKDMALLTKLKEKGYM
ncbi:riboflavin synthase [Candidatus Magnetomonas plexicatena]|uniref:riboflavin synthase n=1 Tax=Candidatus Magnetomonas plexicatena TaxID=2552947 RepID=UPI001101E63B|nr:riboflavin synthase [Nitrospirales bacterium LBB_01]